jgi:hypothetical protein
MKITRNMLYEVARCEPKLLLGLEVTNKHFQNLISSDVSYMHTLIEDLYDEYNIRCQSWA